MDSSWVENGTLAPFASLSPEPENSSSRSGSPSPSGWVPQAGTGPGGSPPFWDTPLNQGLSVFVGLALCTTMLGLGCTVELSQLGGQLRRPVGVLLALLCQFVLMPLLAFLLALLFALDEVAAVAVLLCGCCPGGNLSNIMSLLVNGDMNLRKSFCCNCCNKMC
uniref:Solute carrier family 10 member 4 n=1 Tax=Gopherus agassizii TaxID=38772 RepID=A0A452GQJ3_9SAUR